jgi:hypothetical protein
MGTLFFKFFALNTETVYGILFFKFFALNTETVYGILFFKFFALNKETVYGHIFFMEMTITVIAYLNMLQHFLIEQVEEDNQEGRILFQQDSAPMEVTSNHKDSG